MALPEFSLQDHLGAAVTDRDLLEVTPLIVVLLRGFA
jgi:hypothetical protein